jgi:hypothetical protein
MEYLRFVTEHRTLGHQKVKGNDLVKISRPTLVFRNISISEKYFTNFSGFHSKNFSHYSLPDFDTV